MKKTLLLIIPFILLSVGCKSKKEIPLAQGKKLYEIHCAACHGISGNGEGPLSPNLFPKPRDLTTGILKYRTTRGPVPSDLDILQTMKVGIPGTSMPGWDLLSLQDWESVLAYVKTFSPKWVDRESGPAVEIPEQPKTTPYQVQMGQALYMKSGCISCHGLSGNGDGLAAPILRDVWGDRIAPRNFAHGPLKWGNQPKDIYRTLALGIPGTPMPSYEQTFSKEDLWALAYYIQSLQIPLPKNYDPAEPKRTLIQSKKIEGPLPTNPADTQWKTTEETSVFLKSLWHSGLSTEWLSVKSLHNGHEMAILIRWKDNQKDMSEEKNDSVTAQFPSKSISDPIDLPFLGFGITSPERKLWQTSAINDGVYESGEWNMILKGDIPQKPVGYVSFLLSDPDLPNHSGPDGFSEWMIYETK